MRLASTLTVVKRIRATLVSGQKLSASRRSIPLTQEELAARTGMTLSNIRRIEQSGTTGVYPSTLRALSAALGVEQAAIIASDDTSVRVPAVSPAEVIAWLDVQPVSVVRDILEHAGALVDMASTDAKRTKQKGSPKKG